MIRRLCGFLFNLGIHKLCGARHRTLDCNNCTWNMMAHIAIHVVSEWGYKLSWNQVWVVFIVRGKRCPGYGLSWVQVV